MTQKVLIEIKKYFSSKNILIKEISALEKGTNKNTYKIKTPKEVYILKLFNSKLSVKIKQKIKWLRLAHKLEDITIYPLNEQALSIAGKKGYYYECFKGKPITNSKIPKVFYNFGKTVGHFNKIIALVKCPKVKPSFFKQFEQNKIKKTIKELQSHKNPYFKELGETVLNAYNLILPIFNNTNLKSCRIQLIHSDLHFDNILYNPKNKKFKIIDLDGLNPGPLPSEIAVMMSYALTNDSGKLQKKDLSQLLKGYENQVLLRPLEKKLLPALIVKRKISEFCWLYNKFKEKHFTKNEFDRYHIQTIRNLKSATNNYKALKDLVNGTIL